VFFLGAAAGIGAALLEYSVFSATGLSTKAAGFRNAATVAAMVGLIEEGTKFLVVYYSVYRHREFDEVFDGIVYAVVASLGFATLENIAYVLEGGAGVGVMRALLSVPGHAFFGAIMGFNMGMAKFAGSGERRWLAYGVLGAALAHAAYNAVVLSRTAAALLVVPLVVYLWRRAIGHASHARLLDSQKADGG
jgi:RsiW-degrading membrane proteinase PrsW (M82 family)